MIVIIAGLGEAACMWHLGPLGAWATVRTLIFKTRLFNPYRWGQVIKSINVLHLFPGPTVTGRHFFFSIYFSLSQLFGSKSAEVCWDFPSVRPRPQGRNKTGRWGLCSSLIMLLSPGLCALALLCNYWWIISDPHYLIHHHISHHREEKEQFLWRDCMRYHDTLIIFHYESRRGVFSDLIRSLPSFYGAVVHTIPENPLNHKILHTELSRLNKNIITAGACLNRKWREADYVSSLFTDLMINTTFFYDIQ